MSPHDDIESFYADAERWPEELTELRTILLSRPVSEEWKWRQPVYVAHSANLFTVWAFEDACTLGFFKGALLDDPEGLLEKPGDNSRSSRVMRFRSTAEIDQRKASIETFLDEAISRQKAGEEVDMEAEDTLEPPPELVDKLQTDDKFRAAFEALTPGRQRGWTLHFSGAKQAETRSRRIDKATPKILAGKGMHDR